MDISVRPTGELALFINGWNVADLTHAELTPGVSRAILHAYELGCQRAANQMQTNVAGLDKTFRPGTDFVVTDEHFRAMARIGARRVARLPKKTKVELLRRLAKAKARNLTLTMANGSSVAVARKPAGRKRLRGIR